MPLLPEHFTFSQSSLEDFQACPWRFYLRHIARLSWPALVSEPAEEHERHLRLGSRFHRLVQQHLHGIAAEHLTATIDDPDLAVWWQRYLEALPAAVPGRVLTEHTLVTTVDGFRLLAKYDALVATPDGELLIFDWKTTLKRPPQEQYARSIQTQVYRYVAARAGAHLTGGVLPPEGVRMTYWFPAFPHDPYTLPYSAEQYQADEAALKTMLQAVAWRERPEDFPRTDDERACRYCLYRSLCERGVQAGPLEHLFETEEPPPDLDFDLDQIAEIEF